MNEFTENKCLPNFGTEMKATHTQNYEKTH